MESIVIETRGGQIQNIYVNDEAAAIVVVVDYMEDPPGQVWSLRNLKEMLPETMKHMQRAVRAWVNA